MECNTTGMPKSLVLFTTSRCPNCVPVKAELEKLGLDYSTVVVDEHPNGKQLADEWSVFGVPTMLVAEDGVVNDPIHAPLALGQPLGRYVGPKEIITYARTLQRDVFQEQPGGDPEASGPLLCGVSGEENAGESLR